MVTCLYSTRSSGALRITALHKDYSFTQFENTSSVQTCRAPADYSTSTSAKSVQRFRTRNRNNSLASKGKVNRTSEMNERNVICDLQNNFYFILRIIHKLFYFYRQVVVIFMDDNLQKNHFKYCKLFYEAYLTSSTLKRKSSTSELLSE